MPPERLFTEDDLRAVLTLFFEYRDDHGFCEDDAQYAAINEVIEGHDAAAALYQAEQQQAEDERWRRHYDGLDAHFTTLAVDERIERGKRKRQRRDQ